MPRYGSAGGIERLNALCVLPLNMLYDKVIIVIYGFMWIIINHKYLKMFMILWIVHFLLLVAGGTRLVYRLLQLLFPNLRFLLIRQLQ